MFEKTIVTAIYYYSFNSRMGGRNYSFEYYENPFRNLLSLGMNIVVFSHASEINKIDCFFKRNNFMDYKIIEYDLNNYAFSDMIYSIKEKKNIIDKNGLMSGTCFIMNDRNTHLCLSKIDFLSMAIKENYFGSNVYYWVDAGLFHNGLIPVSLGGAERYVKVVEEKFWPISKSNICNPGLIDRLNEQNNKQKLLFIGMTSFSSPTWFNKVSTINKNVHIIGGIFGGDKEEILKIHSRFKQLVQNVLMLDELTLEEDILSIIIGESNYDYLKFDTWFHDVSTDPCYYYVSEGQRSFYKLFLN
jgi:hypothetical protein